MSSFVWVSGVPWFVRPSCDPHPSRRRPWSRGKESGGSGRKRHAPDVRTRLRGRDADPRTLSEPGKGRKVESGETRGGRAWSDVDGVESSTADEVEVDLLSVDLP